MATEYMVMLKTPLRGYTIGSTGAFTAVRKDYWAVKLASGMLQPEPAEVAQLGQGDIGFVEVAALALNASPDNNLWVFLNKEDIKIIVQVDSSSGIDIDEIANVFVAPDDVLDLATALPS